MSIINEANRNSEPGFLFAQELDGMAITELMVLQSAAGFYIGRACWNGDFVEPYSRNSTTYYKTYKEAKTNLDNNTYPEI